MIRTVKTGIVVFMVLVIVVGVSSCAALPRNTETTPIAITDNCYYTGPVKLTVDITSEELRMSYQAKAE